MMPVFWRVCAGAAALIILYEFAKEVVWWADSGRAAEDVQGVLMVVGILALLGIAVLAIVAIPDEIKERLWAPLWKAIACGGLTSVSLAIFLSPEGHVTLFAGVIAFFAAGAYFGMKQQADYD